MIKRKAILRKNIQALSVSISPAGNEPLDQYYDEQSAAYVPDRSLIPLILVPSLMMDGRDVSAEYTERAWYRITAAGAEEQITASTPGHTLYPTGYDLGLKISANTPYDTAAKYVFRCRAKGSPGMATITLRTGAAVAAKPSLELDCPAAQTWNPFVTTADTLTITPKVFARGKTCTVKWKRILANGTRRDLILTDPEDCELSLNTTTGALTINRRLMGHRAALVCELYVGTSKVDEKPVTISRRIPQYREDCKTNTYFTPSDTSVFAQAQITAQPGGVLADPSAELLIAWFDGSTRVGEGNTHLFPARGKESIDIGMEVTDRGPWCLAADSDGAILTDSDGALLLIR